MGLISGRKAFQKPMEEGVRLLNAIQDVYLSPDAHRAAAAVIGDQRVFPGSGALSETGPFVKNQCKATPKTSKIIHSLKGGVSRAPCSLTMKDRQGFPTP